MKLLHHKTRCGLSYELSTTNWLNVERNYMTKPTVYVQPPTLGADHLFENLLEYPTTHKPEEADLLVLCGGEDINPSLYNEKPITGVWFNPERDTDELNLISTFRGFKPFIGICRGAQLLNVIAGGTLWQDVNNHGRPHKILNQLGTVIGTVNSVHHQMMRPGPGADVLAVAFESTRLVSENEMRDRLSEGEPEVILYPRDRFLCFQAHPEFGHAETTTIFTDYLSAFCAEYLE
jgi:GMP synthase-like glutamine amidotransferase